MKSRLSLLVLVVVVFGLAIVSITRAKQKSHTEFLGSAEKNAQSLVEQGRDIFRYDTFGDEVFWTDQLGLDQLVAATTPRQALDLGLKVDSDALTKSQLQAIKHGTLNLDDPAVTVQLVKQKAVLGVVGTSTNGTLRVGLSCAVCHSTVDNSIAPGIGRRIDGLASRDLNVGAIVASVPKLQPLVDLLSLADPGITTDDVKNVLLAWGPGKFDAELFLDGKGFQPDGTNSAATLMPNARGLSGHNLHTWTGGWGTVTYWNAFVANLELHGVGTFFDERLDNTNQFPIAAKAGFGHVSTDPDNDQITSKLPALHFYQLALPAVKPRPGVDFDPAAAERGDALFSHKADCNRCHREPLWTEPGWNQHTAAEMKIDSFEADRSPGHAYRTMNLAGIFVRENGLFMKPENKGRFYHDGRFRTLLDTVNSYNDRFNLALTEQEKSDLVEYLKSL